MTQISTINKHSLKFIVALVLIFVSAQFMILALVGTKGAEITGIRQQKDELRVQNEYLNAEIDKARTSAQIQNGLDQNFDLQATNVNIVRVDTPTQANALDYVSGN